MGRPREQTLMLTGQVGYRSTTAPEWRLPADRLVQAINVWMGGRAGIAERRCGSTAIPGPDALSQLSGLLGVQWRATVDDGFAYTYEFGDISTLLLVTGDDGSMWYLWVPVSGTYAWQGMTVPEWLLASLDGLLPTQSVTVGNKIFLSGGSSTDLNYVPVIDMTTPTTPLLRRIGVMTPAATTVTNTGSGSYAATARYYRVRWAAISDGVTLRRGEPSPSVAFTPSGSGVAARIARPSTSQVVVLSPESLDSDITHWEVEASTDDATYYRIAEVELATLSYDDSALVATYSSSPLSEDIGDREFSPVTSTTIAIDGNRVLYAGDAAYPNRVWYSRPRGTTDIADEECVPPDHYLDVDADDSDHVTALLGPVDDTILVFKTKSMFRLVKTGDALAPYTPVKIADIGCAGPPYACEGPPRGGVEGEAVYFANLEGAFSYSSGAVTRLSDDIVSGTGTDPTVWWDANYRVVYYEGRQAVLFGNFAYSLLTGGWSYLTDSSTYTSNQVVTRTGGSDSGRLIRLRPIAPNGLCYFDDFWGAAESDINEERVVGTIQFPPLMPFGHGVRYTVTRCRVWAETMLPIGNKWTVYNGPSVRLVVSKATGTMIPAAPDYSAQQEVLAALHVSGANGPYVCQPQHLGVGPADYLSLVLTDDDDQGPYRIHAVELSLLPQEPLA